MIIRLYSALVALLLAAACVTSALAGVQTPGSQSRRWRVVVLIREKHIDRPHIPDPAAETEVVRQLIDAGYKLIDEPRVQELRYSDRIDRIIKGGPSALKEAMKIGRQFGADILVTGDAFTQEVTRSSVDTDVGTLLRIQCRCRIEVKAIRMDTAEIFYSDAVTLTGSPESTVELSSKTCLQQGAERLSPGLLKKLDGLAAGKSQYIELQIRGVASFSGGRALEKALKLLPGVLDTTPGDYDAGTYRTEVQLQKQAVADFAARLESASSLKRFHLKVVSANGSRIIVRSK